MAVVQYPEVKFAQDFLKAVGGNWTDSYLILAVAAWLEATPSIRTDTQAVLRMLRTQPYKQVLYDFQHKHGSKGAVLILTALSLAGWNGIHYLDKQRRNRLLIYLSRFTGLQLQPPTKKPPKPRPPLPPAPRSPQPVAAQKWPDPLAPRDFLQARQWKPKLGTL